MAPWRIMGIATQRESSGSMRLALASSSILTATSLLTLTWCKERSASESPIRQSVLDANLPIQIIGFVNADFCFFGLCCMSRPDDLLHLSSHRFVHSFHNPLCRGA